MTTATRIQPELVPYLDELAGALAAVTEVDAIYLLGSAALGAYVPGESDVDIVAVTARSLSPGERRTLAAAAEAVPCPARKLELVVYPRGSDEWQLNLNTSEHVSFDPADEPGFWFVLDRALAEQHAVALVGPPWSELFEPVAPEAVLDALEESLDTVGAPNLARALVWLDTGEWTSKPAAEDWLRDRIRERIEAAR